MNRGSRRAARSAGAAAVFGALAVPAVVSVARAEDPEPVRLVWVRAPGAEACPDGAAIAQSVTARLGKNVFSEGASRTLEAVVQREVGPVWTAHIYLRDARGALVGSREFESRAEDCATLQAVATLALALAIDPEAALRAGGDAGAIATTTANAPAPTPTPAPAPTPTPTPTPSSEPRVRSFDGSATLRAVVAQGLLPATAPGAAVAGDVRTSSATYAEAALVFLPDVRTTAGDFGFGLTFAQLGMCVDPWQRPGFSVSGCGRLAAGAIHAVVYQLEPTQPGDRFWAGASAAAVARLRLLGPIDAEAGAELVIPLTRQRFLVEGQSAAVYQESPVAGLAFVGLGASIP